MNRRARLALTVALILGLSALAALLASNAGAGTDDRATETVDAMTSGGYDPWIQASTVPGGEGNAPIFVGVQAFAGLAIIAGCLWYWREHRSGA